MRKARYLISAIVIVFASFSALAYSPSDLISLHATSLMDVYHTAKAETGLYQPTKAIPAAREDADTRRSMLSSLYKDLPLSNWTPLSNGVTVYVTAGGSHAREFIVYRPLHIV